MAKTFAKDLGKCYDKSEDGFYRLYNVDGYWVIYLVLKGDSGRLEATQAGYITEPDAFDYGVYVLECEEREMMRELEAEFGHLV
jgi:hypothetical protein